MFLVLLIGFTATQMCLAEDMGVPVPPPVPKTHKQLIEENQKQIIGVSLDDIATHLSGVIPQLDFINKDLQERPELYLDESPKKILHSFTRYLPEIKDQQVSLYITTLIEKDDGLLYFYNLLFEYDLNDISTLVVGVDSILPLALTRFKIEASLVARTLVMFDVMSGTIMVFPIGVGGFDEGILNKKRETALVSPTHKVAYLDKTTAIKKRSKPAYYQGKPFIRVMTNKSVDKGWSAVGFHIKQNKVFKRGFDSHGCFRLRPHDLQVLYNLLMEGPERHIQTTIKYMLETFYDHPYPLYEDSYKTVHNIGTREKPKHVRKKGLVYMKRANQYPPIEDVEEYQREMKEMQELWMVKFLF